MIRVLLVPFMGALAAVLCIAMPAFAEDPFRPDPKLTPGAVFEVSTAEVCRRGYARSVRHVDGKTKAMVYREYGIRRHEGSAYEIDHLISLELGGSNDIRNLWPESFDTQSWNAHVKDKLEDRLHKLVCDGTLSLREAQAAIASDWTAAYRKYVDER